MKFITSIALLMIGLALPAQALAHGPLHEQIANLTRLIEQFPDSAELYVERGELHRHHLDGPAAMADYDRASSLDPQLALVDLCRGKMLFDSGFPEKARLALDRFLANAPNDAEGFLTRARVLAQLGEYLPAADDFRRVIMLKDTPQPEYYLERAQALSALGKTDEALLCLDEGMQRLGAIVTLQLYAIDLEIMQKSYDAALARLEKVAAQSPRKEKWLMRRGEILKLAGRDGEARLAFHAALQEIEALPASRRNTKAVIDLEKRLRAEL